MKLRFRVIESEGFYIGSLEEYPAGNTQGKTLRELKENLLDALQLYLESEGDEQGQRQQKQLVRL